MVFSVKTVKKWIGRILSLFLTLIFIAGAYICFCVVRAKGNEVPQVFGFSVLRVQTGSMTEVFAPGEVILVRKTDPATIQIGDIICFYSTDPVLDGRPNTHRVIEITEQEDGTRVFTTKGDSNPTEDEYPVEESHLVGRYICNLKAYGKFFSIVQNPFIFFFVLIVPLVLILMLELNKVTTMAKQKEKLPEKKEDTHDDETDPT